MCAIAGVVSFRPERAVDPDRLVRMRDAMAHRGPDGAGCWCEGPVGLAHRRLAIVDVAGGHQPMANESRSVWLVFNGEIYNHAELRPRLVARGHAYRTRSDTETILHAYEEWGADALNHLEGMFAFALWDRQKRQLLVGRDRLGIKPLYLAQRPHELLVASEIKALVAGGVVPSLNASALPEYLAHRYVTGRGTLFQDIEALEPGHVLTWSPGHRPAISRYWHLPPTSAETAMSAGDAADLVRTELRAAVERHLMSDVPVGVFLSGGLDSSALAAIASDMSEERLSTFAVGFDEPEGNELPYARMVARAIGADHRELVLDGAAFFEALPDLVWSQDEPMPFSSGVPLYAISTLAQRHVKVVLTGEGADELFLGYQRYRVTHWNERLGRPYWRLPPAWRTWVRHAIEGAPSSIGRYLRRTFLALEPGSHTLFFDNFAVFNAATRRALLGDAAADARPYAFGQQCYDESAGTSLDRMSAVDLQTYLVALLMKQDRMSMAASIESRVPFLDDRLVGTIAGLPARFKLRGWRTKAVLRDAVQPLLPRAILTRRKMGFPVPLARWFRGGHRAVVDEFVTGSRALARGLFDPDAVRRLAGEHECGVNHAERLWLLLNLEIWQRVFCDGEAPADVMGPVRIHVRGNGHAGDLGQDGRAVAPEHWRPTSHLPDPLESLDRPPRHPGDDARA